MKVIEYHIPVGIIGGWYARRFFIDATATRDQITDAVKDDLRRWVSNIDATWREVDINHD